jgi:molecular chaperone DnaK
MLSSENTTIPTKAQQVFSTADDNQSTVTIHVLTTRRRVGQQAWPGSISRASTAPARPQIEVTFDIGENGILHVGEGQATGRPNQIRSRRAPASPKTKFNG